MEKPIHKLGLWIKQHGGRQGRATRASLGKLKHEGNTTWRELGRAHPTGDVL